MPNVENEEGVRSEYDEILFIFTLTSNQIIKEEKNNITLNFGDWINELKSGYNISSNYSLYILEIISQEENIKIPKIEYEIYYPFNNKYNPKSEYYNDICSTTTSKLGTDISLNDRRYDLWMIICFYVKKIVH